MFMPFAFVRSLLRLTRFWNLCIIALTQYITAYFLVDPSTLTDLRLLVLTLSTVLIAAAGYIINDYYDVKIDLINKPDRVVIGKEVPRRHAMIYHTILSVVGALLGLWLSWKIALLNVVSSFLLWVYSNALKRLPLVGNMAVSLLTGLGVYMINILYKPFHLLVLVYALFAFFITLVREIIKDLEDLKGDGTFGCKTLPIIWGVRRTKNFAIFLLVLFFGLILTINFQVAPLPMTFFAGLLLLPLLLLVIWLNRADTRKDFYQLSQFCKLIMIAGILSMAFL
jgi:4-hydroxybenzoate polyprenyltransferase